MGLPPQSGFTGRMLAGVIASVVGTLACSQAWAQSEVTSQTGSPTLKIDEARRYFVRFGYVAMKPNTKSGEVKDASGYVASRDEIIAYGKYLNNLPSPTPTQSSELIQAQLISGYDFAADADMNTGMYADGLKGLGIPRGITVEAKSAGTPAVSLGYFLDEDQQWAVEGFVLAVPLKNEVYGHQKVNVFNTSTSTWSTRAGTLDGKKIMTTQVLPPLVMLTRYFGDKNATWRPSLGVGGAYAIFFDSKVPQLVSTYSGGKTTVSLKNSFGFGGFAGLQYRIDERWHLNATLGYLKLKTTGSITTNETRFTKSSAVLQDLGGYTANAIRVGATGPVNNMLIDLADWKNGRSTRNGDYGKFVRTIDAQLDPYIFWISAGYSF
jgi:outer membrane protein W